MSTLHTAAEIEAAKQALNDEARANFHDPMYRKDMAEAIGTELYEGFKNNNLVELFTDVEYLPLDGRLTFEEVKGLKAFWMERNGYIEESYIEKEVLEVLPDTIGFHVVESEDRIETRFSETASTLVDLGFQRLDSEVNRRVLTTLQSTIGIGHPSYVPVANLSMGSLNAAIDRVKDASVDGEVAIIGRPTVTNKIADVLSSNNTFGFYTPETNEEVLRRGKVATYRGASIIELKNYRDADGNPFFPANELFIVGKGAGKTGFFGGMKVKEHVEGLNWYWHFLAKLDVGVAFIDRRQDRLARIVVSNIAP